MPPRRPLVSQLELQSPADIYSPSSSTEDAGTSSKKHPWYYYIPVAGTALLILAPQPSLLYVLVNYHLRTLGKPLVFGIHLISTYTLTFLAFCSFIICIARDPGPISSEESPTAEDDGEIGVQDALMSTDFDIFAPGKWCRKCWAPKPERTHHCSVCDRCVLKMDHHCPWMGQCIGHRTYPAFLHFLFCVTLLSIYIAVICIFALIFAFTNPYAIDQTTPIHELLLAAAGIVFSFVVGSFFCYHLYLVSSNQTTLENISPFLLLRYLPPLPRGAHSLSDPPLEPELSYAQRRIVKDAHSCIRLYDFGWRRNWNQAVGWNRPYGWVYRILCGGASMGDGKSYPRNPGCDEMLARLAEELVKADKDR
ncbi:DHHC palmitoyltransferase-domain-containing protein [Mycena floridula]|nr:DHHC palmitoyltransferase-domain-containing protein [Mycena floridula]